MPLLDGVNKAITRKSIANHFFRPVWPYQFEGGRQFYTPRKLDPRNIVTSPSFHPPSLARVPRLGIIDDPQPQQRREMAPSLLGQGAPPVVVNNPPFRRQQPWPYTTAPYPQQARVLRIESFTPGEVVTDDPPGVRVPTFGVIPDPWPQQARVLVVQPFVAAPAAPDNPPPIRRHPVWGWGPTEPIFAPALGDVVATPGSPQPPRLWLNTVYKAWEPPYVPPQQKILTARFESAAPAATVNDPPSVRVPVFYTIPDPQPQQARKFVVQEFVVAPQPEPEPEPGVGGIWVPHSFTRKRCKELLEEIARERAAAQALPAAPKKAVLAAAKAAAGAVRDACDLCPAEASGAIYAEARDVVESLHQLMAADLAAKAIIARAKEVQRQAEMLRRAAEEADDDDAISILLMGM